MCPSSILQKCSVYHWVFALTTYVFYRRECKFSSNITVRKLCLSSSCPRWIFMAFVLGTAPSPPNRSSLQPWIFATKWERPSKQIGGWNLSGRTKCSCRKTELRQGWYYYEYFLCTCVYISEAIRRTVIKIRPQTVRRHQVVIRGAYPGLLSRHEIKANVSRSVCTRPDQTRPHLRLSADFFFWRRHSHTQSFWSAILSTRHWWSWFLVFGNDHLAFGGGST